MYDFRRSGKPRLLHRARQEPMSNFRVVAWLAWLTFLMVWQRLMQIVMLSSRERGTTGETS